MVRSEEATTYTLPNGVQLIVTPHAAQVRELDGTHRWYIPHEHVAYAPTLGEQYLQQRGVQK